MKKYICKYNIFKHSKDYLCQFFSENHDKYDLRDTAIHNIIHDNDEKYLKREIKIISILEVNYLSPPPTEIFLDKAA